MDGAITWQLIRPLLQCLVSQPPDDAGREHGSWELTVSHYNQSQVSIESHEKRGQATEGIETYLSVIRGARREEGLEGVVTGDEETGKVDEELASDVEKDKEEVDSDQAEDRIDLGDISLTLKVVEDRVLGELSTINVSQQEKPLSHTWAAVMLGWTVGGSC